MYSLYLVGALAGFAAGALQLFLSYVAPSFSAGNFIAETGETAVLGRRFTRREAHLAGALIHLVASAVFGLIYGAAVKLQIVPGFTLLGIMSWALMLTLFAGLVLMPLEGHGVFGRKHDAWFMADSAIAHALWGFAYYVLVRVWIAG